MKRLLTLNIEADHRLETVRAFLETQNADIVCLQEVFREDIDSLIRSEYHVEFLPMCVKVRANGAIGEWGVAIAAKTEPRTVESDYYYQPSTSLHHADDTTAEHRRRTYRQGVVGMTLEDETGSEFVVFTTHFTWTPKGASNQYQATDMEQLLTYLATKQPHVLCGDFNMPRGYNAVYPLLRSHYTDHVPESCVTSMYLPFHRVKDDPVEGPRISKYMVDYILSTPGIYEVTNFTMHDQVSDHCALTADILRVNS